MPLVCGSSGHSVVWGALDISRARQLFDYCPLYSLETGLREYIAFILEHNHSLFRQDRPKSAADSNAHRITAMTHSNTLDPLRL